MLAVGAPQRPLDTYVAVVEARKLLSGTRFAARLPVGCSSTGLTCSDREKPQQDYILRTY